jgi:transcriptional regulator with XRE-family HTH domain
MFVAMSRHEKTRDKTSTALIALRAASGQTQQEFAVEVLKTAVTTIARYESTHPPRGEVLLRLADIADQRRRFDLADVFRHSYLEQALKTINSRLFSVRSMDAHKTRGYLIARLQGQEENRAADNFLLLIAGSRATDPKLKAIAAEAFDQIAEAASKLGDIDEDVIRYANVRRQK